MPEETISETSLIKIGREFAKLFSRIKGHLDEKWGTDKVNGETIIRLIEQVAIHDREATRQVGAQGGGAQAQAQTTPQQQVTQSGQQGTQQQSVTCDVCGNPMKTRKGPHGFFWGCTAYKPDNTGCNRTIPIPADDSQQQPAPQPQPAQVQSETKHFGVGPQDEDIPF